MRRWFAWVAMAGGVFVVLGGVLAITYRHGHFYERGPYARALDSRWDLSGLNVQTKTPVMLGGAPILNPARADLQILSVAPTNLPPGLQLISSLGFHVPQAIGIGPLSWVRTLPHHTLQRTPTDASRTAMEPALIVQAARPGRYVIQGLLVTYQLGSARYTDYARTQFVVCAYATAQATRRAAQHAVGCAAHVPPPPATWP